MIWHDQGCEAISFDDVLIRPSYSELESRQDSDPYQKITINKVEIKLAPIIVANMTTLTTVEMCSALYDVGVVVPFHRFQSIEQQVETLKEACKSKYRSDGRTPIAATVGLNEPERVEKVVEYCDMLFLELAHADTKPCVKEIKRIKKQFPDKFLVVGNVATATATKRLRDAGADLIKVGVGNGATCITRLVTGCGVPQLSAIAECSPHADIIADGGVRYGSDALKCLAAGAKFIMVGSLFAGTDEASRANPDGTHAYFGMASKEAGKVNNGNVPEGISATVRYSGAAAKVANELISSIRQGMAMIGAANLDELIEKAVFQRVSPLTLSESKPHILER